MSRFLMFSQEDSKKSSKNEGGKKGDNNLSTWMIKSRNAAKLHPNILNYAWMSDVKILQGYVSANISKR